MNPQETPPQNTQNIVTPSPEIKQTPPKKLSKKMKIFITLDAVILVSILVGVFLKFSPKSNPINKITEATKTTSPTPTATTKKDAIEIPDSINPIDPTKLPLGEKKYTATSPKIGYVYSCQANFSPLAGGAQVAGPWINLNEKTWNSTQKIAVSGNVSWPNAAYSVTVEGANRKIVANNVPINNQTTGVFPIQRTDPAYSYDRNPNRIATKTINWTLPVDPILSSPAKCANMGAIGILEDGVVLFNALDGEGRDAAAYETLDSCDGHPERTSEYHHHDIPSCILSKYTAPNTSSLVGYAIDGYGIYVERDKNGNLLTNQNLDECHGRTSNVLWDGKIVNMYHYVATLEYPYTIGCFRATPAVTTTQPR